MRWMMICIGICLLQGCQTAQLYYSQGAEGKNSSEIAWIVTPMNTIVYEVDGAEVDNGFAMFSGDQVRSWVGVPPGIHELTLYYHDGGAGVSSAGASTLRIQSFAGKTNYVYGISRGGISYRQLLLDRPADESLINHVRGRILDHQMPCPTLPCND